MSTQQGAAFGTTSVGQANQRYPLLFRDYLRAHPHSAQAYATLKKDFGSSRMQGSRPLRAVILDAGRPGWAR